MSYATFNSDAPGTIVKLTFQRDNGAMEVNEVQIMGFTALLSTIAALLFTTIVGGCAKVFPHFEYYSGFVLRKDGNQMKILNTEQDVSLLDNMEE